ncbi:MAG: MotA/TolQ/ExbB proton channel family protein [Proteobacteria bacterium]|nr:MotA/TolQ/ExbB proton channel family protein [Pseudomonadota bacterium]
MIQKILPVFGIFIFVLLSGTVSELSSISVNIKSNLIVLTGTLVCCCISYPPKLFSELFASIRQAFSTDKKDFNGIINEIEALSVIRRSQGIVELDKKTNQIENEFLRMGIEMVVDGYDRYTIFKTLERRYDNFLGTRRSQADLINTMIKLLPVFGFVGTIIGLINVLNNMGTPALIGKGVATALLTTFYGLLYANLLCLPLGKKLTEKTKQDSIELALIIEGVLDIADKVNSKLIGYRLRYCIGELYQEDPSFETKLNGSQEGLPALKLALKKQFSRG